MPHIWQDGSAKEAAEFYTKLFPDSKITGTSHYGTAGYEIHGQEKGMVMNVSFEVMGYRMMTLNGGPAFKVNPSISFMVNFDPSQMDGAEVKLDKIWPELVDGGKVLMELGKYDFSPKYGWVADRYGVSWQLILTDPEGEPRPLVLPSLLFVGDKAGKAEEAVNYYLEVFGDKGKLGSRHYYPDGQLPGHEGMVMFSDFMLFGQWFTAMDSAMEHKFQFNEAISLMLYCKDQEEIDYYWEKLSAVPEAEQCGWLKDKFGVSWQVVPENLDQFLATTDPDAFDRVMEAILPMKKLDLAKIEAAKKA